MEADDLKLRIDQIDRARRDLGHSVDASGIALRRALHTDEPGRERDVDSWPRQTKVRSRFYPRVGAALLLSVVVLLAVIVQLRRPAVQTAPGGVATEQVVPSVPVASVDLPLTRAPFDIHVRATRPCRVRILVDGTALDWRDLKEGDEFVSRPAREILIESDDTGALDATVNGRSTRIEEINSLFQRPAK